MVNVRRVLVEDQFSTDPVCLPGMLAWLARHESDHWNIQWVVYWHRVWAVAGGIGWSAEASGATIMEAVARLVVAVKEAQK